MNAATFSPRSSAMRRASLTAPFDEPQQTMPRSAFSGPKRRARWYLSRMGLSFRYRFAFIFSCTRCIEAGRPDSSCSRPFVW